MPMLKQDFITKLDYLIESLNDIQNEGKIFLENSENKKNIKKLQKYIKRGKKIIVAIENTKTQYILNIELLIVGKREIKKYLKLNGKTRNYLEDFLRQFTYPLINKLMEIKQ